MRARRAAMAIALLWCAAAVPARAHLMPQQQGTINARDGAVFCVFSIPVSAITGWDHDSSGRMSVHEFALQRASINQQVNAGLHLQSGNDLGRRDFLQVTPDADAADLVNASDVTHLLVLVRHSFRTAPVDLQLRLSLFGATPAEQQYLIKATQGGAPQVAQLGLGRESHTFFRSRGPGLIDGAADLVSWVRGAVRHLRALLVSR